MSSRDAARRAPRRAARAWQIVFTLCITVLRTIRSKQFGCVLAAVALGACASAVSPAGDADGFEDGPPDVADGDYCNPPPPIVPDGTQHGSDCLPVAFNACLAWGSELIRRDSDWRLPVVDCVTDASGHSRCVRADLCEGATCWCGDVPRGGAVECATDQVCMQSEGDSLHTCVPIHHPCIVELIDGG